MDNPPTTYKAAVADYLAAERTLLAWVRTGLALMGFGFVVARFGLFLQQLAAIEHTATERSFGLSLWFGTALIVAGVLVNVASAVRHVRMMRELDRGNVSGVRSVAQAVATAAAREGSRRPADHVARRRLDDPRIPRLSSAPARMVARLRAAPPGSPERRRERSCIGDPRA